MNDINKGTGIIYVRRIKETENSTLGKLTIQGVHGKFWYVLEPGGPDSNIEGSDQRISAGTYMLAPYSSAHYHHVYQVTHVQGRTSILVHSGNYHRDTLGCLMPGKTWGIDKEKQYAVYNSKAALKQIFSEIKKFDKIKIVISNQIQNKKTDN